MYACMHENSSSIIIFLQIPYQAYTYTYVPKSSKGTRIMYATVQFWVSGWVREGGREGGRFTRIPTLLCYFKVYSELRKSSRPILFTLICVNFVHKFFFVLEIFV